MNLRQRVKELAEVALLLQNVPCSQLHHEKGEFHEADEACPVMVRIAKVNANPTAIVNKLFKLSHTAQKALEDCPSNKSGITHAALETILEAL